MEKTDISIIRVIAHIHPDGDIYIKGKDGFKYFGKIGESDFGRVPDPYYIKIKKYINKK